MATRKSGQGSKWIRKSTRLAIYLRDGMACVYCGATVEDGALLTLDHLAPASRGGQNAPTNLVCCCGRCNSARGNRGLARWIRDVAQYTGEAADSITRRVRRTVRRQLPRDEARAMIERR